MVVMSVDSWIGFVGCLHFRVEPRVACFDQVVDSQIAVDEGAENEE